MESMIKQVLAKNPIDFLQVLVLSFLESLAMLIPGGILKGILLLCRKKSLIT
jgi:hypothetical protein